MVAHSPHARTGAATMTRLPSTGHHTVAIDVIDTWEMTVEEVEAGARGTVDVPLPSRPWMAVRVRCD